MLLGNHLGCGNHRPRPSIPLLCFVRLFFSWLKFYSHAVLQALWLGSVGRDTRGVGGYPDPDTCSASSLFQSPGNACSFGAQAAEVHLQKRWVFFSYFLCILPLNAINRFSFTVAKDLDFQVSSEPKSTSYF